MKTPGGKLFRQRMAMSPLRQAYPVVPPAETPGFGGAPAGSLQRRSCPVRLAGILSDISPDRKSFRPGSRPAFCPHPTAAKPEACPTGKPPPKAKTDLPAGKSVFHPWNQISGYRPSSAQPPFAAALLALLALPVLGVTGLPIWDSAVLTWGSSATAVSRMFAFWLSVSADSRSGVMP